MSKYLALLLPICMYFTHFLCAFYAFFFTYLLIFLARPTPLYARLFGLIFIYRAQDLGGHLPDLRDGTVRTYSRNNQKNVARSVKKHGLSARADSATAVGLPLFRSKKSNRFAPRATSGTTNHFVHVDCRQRVGRQNQRSR